MSKVMLHGHKGLHIYTVQYTVEHLHLFLQPFLQPHLSS